MHSLFYHPLLIRLVKKVTAWAWQGEIQTCEGLAEIKSLSAEPGKIECKIEQDPAVAQWVAKCFASLVCSSPNYTELKFDVDGKYKDKYEWVIVLVQKGNGKTPHQLRQEAEDECAEYKKRLKFYEA